jgi:hypothetical protein
MLHLQFKPQFMGDSKGNLPTPANKIALQHQVWAAAIVPSNVALHMPGHESRTPGLRSALKSRILHVLLTKASSSFIVHLMARIIKEYTV